MTLHLSGWLLSKKKIKPQKTASDGEDVENVESLYVVGEGAKWCCCCGKWYGGSLKKLKVELPNDPAISRLSIYPEELQSGSQRDICNPMFVTALFTIAKMWAQPTCSSTSKWTDRMQYRHTTECHSTLEKKEILQHATAWMNLKDIFLSQINSSQKDNQGMIPVTGSISDSQIHRSKSEMVAGAERAGGWIVTISECKLPGK